MSNYGVNTLAFDIDIFELEIRKVLKTYLRKDDVVNYFGSEIYIIPMEVDIVDKSKLPAVEISITNDGSDRITQEDIQIQYANNFTVEINTYTSGENKRLKNIKLSKYIVDILQTSQRLGIYFNRGLRLMQDREISSIVDGVDRRQIRLSGLCDNNKKLIYSI